MNCRRCGNILSPTDKVCANCGEPVNPVNNMPESMPNPNNNIQQVNPNLNNQNNMVGGMSGQYVPPQTPQQPESLNPNFNVNQNNMNTNPNFNNVNSGMSQNINYQPNNAPNNGYYNPNMNINQMPNQNYDINQPQPKKKKNVIFIIIVIILVLAIAVLGYLFLTKKIFNKEENKPNTPEEIIPDEEDDDDSKTQVSNTNAYKYQDFEFIIPEGYTASVDAQSDGLVLQNRLARVATLSYIHPYVTIDDYNSQYEFLKEQLEGQGATINSKENKNISGIDWLILNCTLVNDGETMNVTEGFASLGEYHVMETLIYNVGSTSNDQILNDLSTMIASATYKGSANFSKQLV